jgi:hypothetical protein
MSEDGTSCRAVETKFPLSIRNRVSTPLPTNHRGRRELLRRIQGFTTKHSLRMCGSTMATNDKRLDLETYWAPPHDVRVDLSDRGVCFRGLFRCKSRHGCVYCARKVAYTTQEEMKAVCAAFLEAHPKGAIGFLTATVPHKIQTLLEDSLDVVLKAWRSVRQGRLATRLKSLGMAGYIRALDVTYGGNNGWHPHIHALVLFERKPSDIQLETIEGEMFNRWNTYVQRRGFPPVSAKRFRLERSRQIHDVARYCAEASGTRTWSSVARELAVGVKLKSKGFTPAALYVKAAHGEDWAVDKVHEFERVTYNRKFVTWSRLARKLRAQVEPNVPPSDLEDTESTAVFFLPVWMYRRLRSMPGAFDILDMVFAVGTTSSKTTDYAGREVWAYERGSPAHTAHIWLSACFERADGKVPVGAWALTIDFLAILCSELELLCSPHDWWAGNSWITDGIGTV